MKSLIVKLKLIERARKKKPCEILAILLSFFYICDFVFVCVCVCCNYFRCRCLSLLTILRQMKVQTHHSQCHRHYIKSCKYHVNSLAFQFPFREIPNTEREIQLTAFHSVKTHGHHRLNGRRALWTADRKKKMMTMKTNNGQEFRNEKLENTTYN